MTYMFTYKHILLNFNLIIFKQKMSSIITSNFNLIQQNSIWDKLIDKDQFIFDNKEFKTKKIIRGKFI